MWKLELTVCRYNKVGNRELYMNCAVVNIVGSRSSKTRDTQDLDNLGSDQDADAKPSEDSSSAAQAALANLPDLYVANLPSINSCKVPETTDANFDNPGHDVVHLGDSESLSFSKRAPGACTGIGHTSAPGSSSSSSSSSLGGSSPPSSPSSNSGGNDGQWHSDNQQNMSPTGGSSQKPAFCNDGGWHPECYGLPPKQSSVSPRPDTGNMRSSSPSSLPPSSSPSSNDAPQDPDNVQQAVAQMEKHFDNGDPQSSDSFSGNSASSDADVVKQAIDEAEQNAHSRHSSKFQGQPSAPIVRIQVPAEDDSSDDDTLTCGQVGVEGDEGQKSKSSDNENDDEDSDFGFSGLYSQIRKRQALENDLPTLDPEDEGEDSIDNIEVISDDTTSFMVSDLHMSNSLNKMSKDQMGIGKEPLVVEAAFNQARGSLLTYSPHVPLLRR